MAPKTMGCLENNKQLIVAGIQVFRRDGDKKKWEIKLEFDHNGPCRTSEEVRPSPEGKW